MNEFYRLCFAIALCLVVATAVTVVIWLFDGRDERE
jgi:hypothetical protein